MGYLRHLQDNINLKEIDSEFYDHITKTGPSKLSVGVTQNKKQNFLVEISTKCEPEFIRSEGKYMNGHSMSGSNVPKFIKLLSKYSTQTHPGLRHDLYLAQILSPKYIIEINGLYRQFNIDVTDFGVKLESPNTIKYAFQTNNVSRFGEDFRQYVQNNNIQYEYKVCDKYHKTVTHQKSQEIT